MILNCLHNGPCCPRDAVRTAFSKTKDGFCKDSFQYKRKIVRLAGGQQQQMVRSFPSDLVTYRTLHGQTLDKAPPCTWTKRNPNQE